MDHLDDLPTIERIRTKTDIHRELRKVTAARARKGTCYKRPFSRKQALDSKHRTQKERPGTPLFTYKCKACGYWHLSHVRPWDKPVMRKQATSRLSTIV
jgi:hypothetical protein